MNENTLNIVIGGEAGQGIVTIGEALTKALVRSGFSALVTQSYQSRIRGGHNSFEIRFGNEKITAPAEIIDMLVALNAETAELHKNKIKKGGIILVDSKDAGACGSDCIAVPYKEFAEAKHINTAALGVAASILNLAEEIVNGVMTEKLGSKINAEGTEKNKEVIRKAYAWASSQKIPFKKLSPAGKTSANLTLNGNQAIALGAIAAGLKFYSFYPMTPSTSIALGIISHADEMEIMVEQAEDEISAVNMAIGASYAGARSMVGTSGGGFALMVEGVSLAAMTETPIVIAVGQRPGPATGLPTRTEQADLDFVLHAGHGEFPRAIFAPATPEECFHLTKKAFALAEKFQSPVFILTDQYLADSYREVDPKEIQVNAEQNFAISLRPLPGASKKLVVVDSDEHTKDGHLTEDLAVRKEMVEKRLAKLTGLTKEVVPPKYEGEKNPDTLFVTWGSTCGSVIEASRALAQKGLRTGALLFSQLWPLVPEHSIGILKGAKKVVAVEGNAFGQFAGLLQRELCFEIQDRILRFDGLPITPEYILEAKKW